MLRCVAWSPCTDSSRLYIEGAGTCLCISAANLEDPSTRHRTQYKISGSSGQPEGAPYKGDHRKRALILSAVYRHENKCRSLNIGKK
ncbi:hypothetical protein GDO81_011083 [Engystomops pustulosus]|uniref:Uncharacterized protein n=1 Tax=Engystomops pustulosus TaxID=76066 RepID=A0AAV7C652_ENGPU|nr:hypothetical protein GDO81_011083 [Engystomops pustulosus]